MLIYSLREYVDTKILVTANFEHLSSSPKEANRFIECLRNSHTGLLA